ncbi:MAG: Ig-like domain-containing protein [Verrucomicrobiota bacterium]
MPALSATNSFQVTVNEVNAAPVLPGQTSRAITELTLLTVTNTATDADLPANTLTYQLVNPPSGALIDASGVITWTPTEAQGPGVYTITTIVTDNGTPALSATNSFQVTVNEANIAPVLPVQGPQTINELTLLTVTNTATDADVPANTLTYQLQSPPAGAVIDANGVITWTPTEAQGPGVYTIRTIVTDNGTPSRSATNSFQVTVNEVNTAPVLPVLPPVTSTGLAIITITNTATDADLPANTLTYQLVNQPSGTAIDSHGVIIWHVIAGEVGKVWTLTTIVTDNGTPALSATNTVTVTINKVAGGPIAQPDVYDIGSGSNLVVAAPGVLANDTDVTGYGLTAVLLTGPSHGNLTLNANGAFTYVPTASAARTASLTAPPMA